LGGLVVDYRGDLDMWHYVQNAQACGPIETSALQALFQNGSLKLDALVWKSGMADWAPAGSLAEFAATLPGGMAPPPIPLSALPPKGQGPVTTAAADKSDIEENKVFAVLAYIGILFLVPLLVAPKSRFARYHTNQGIILFLAAFILGFGALVLLPIPLIHVLILPVWVVLPACVFVFVVIGIVHAVSGEYKPLPWIGHYRLLS
jgi:uncharacterized membrane protein